MTTDSEPKDYARERHRMVAMQLITRGIQDPYVLKAMEMVPRHGFVPEILQPHSYEDGPLPIGGGQTISQPYIVAAMVEAATIPHDKEGSRVLEIGTGSGYGAAVIAQLASHVYTIERLPPLAAQAQRRLQDLGIVNVTVLTGDGTLGCLEHAPYDAIIVTASSPSIPSILRRQLALGAAMVIPVGDGDLQELMRIERRADDTYQETVVIDAVRFVPLIGHEGW